MSTDVLPSRSRSLIADLVLCERRLHTDGHTLYCNITARSKLRESSISLDEEEEGLRIVNSILTKLRMYNLSRASLLDDMRGSLSARMQYNGVCMM